MRGKDIYPRVGLLRRHSGFNDVANQCPILFTGALRDVKITQANHIDLLRAKSGNGMWTDMAT